MKLQHKNNCVLHGITKKPIYFLFNIIYLLEPNITLQKIGFQSHLHLEFNIVKTYFHNVKFLD
jgi:GH35 family endo-1,4-beta-xylanase